MMACHKRHDDTSEASPLLASPGGAQGPSTTAIQGVPVPASLTEGSSWRVGLALATLSGILFTGNNFLIQFFEVNPFEILLVRSVLQSVVLGMIAANVEHETLVPASWTGRLCVLSQAFLGGLKLYFNFNCLAYMPLGDALTLIFTEPLFTVILSYLVLRISISIWKVVLCTSLLAGMVISIQPPFLFPPEEIYDLVDNGSLGSHGEMETSYLKSDYFFGVIMALLCAVCGSLCNITISQCTGLTSTALVFYTGLAGIVISIAGCYLEHSESALMTSMEDLNTTSWSLLLLISAVGVLGYLSMTQALRTITPTSVSVLRALEIILAYICQIVFMKQLPNVLCVTGGLLVMLSVIGIAVEEKYNAKPRQPTRNPYEHI